MYSEFLKYEKMLADIYQLAKLYGVKSDKAQDFISQNSVKTQSGKFISFSKPVADVLGQLEIMGCNKVSEVQIAQKEYALLSAENPHLNESFYIGNRLKGSSLFKSVIQARQIIERRSLTLFQKMAAFAVVGALASSIWVPSVMQKQKINKQPSFNISKQEQREHN